MQSLPPLAQLRSFVAVVVHGRFNRAAEALHLTESAVSHHLRRLEDALGMRLLERGRGDAVLTPAGERFHARVRDALQLIEDAVDETARVRGGKVVLTLPRALATHWLLPRYPRLYQGRDDLELQLLPTTRTCDLERERIDLGLRMGDGQWPGLEARALLAERIAPVAAPALAAEWRAHGWDAMAVRHRLVLNATHPQEWIHWCRATGYALPSGVRFTPLESFDLVLQAGLAGSGLVMGRTPMVDDALARGDLVAPFPEWLTGRNRYFVVWPSARPPGRHTAVVVDRLAACAAESGESLVESWQSVAEPAADAGDGSNAANRARRGPDLAR